MIPARHGPLAKAIRMSSEANKAVIRRVNTEAFAGGSLAAFKELVAADFINRTAPPGTPNGPETLWNTFQNILRPALSQLSVEIHDQVAEDDKVTTRKTFSGVHTGVLMGIEPTGRSVSIDVIDIVRIRDGQYAEHWGINTLPLVLAELRKA